MRHEALGRDDTWQDTFDRLREDEELYDLACLKIRTKSGDLVPLAWNFAQRYLVGKLQEQEKTENRVRAVILKARQEGVSTKVAARFFRRANLWSGEKCLILADALDRAEAIFSIYERYHMNLPPELRPEVVTRASRRSLRYAHDSEIAVRPASDKDAGRAQTIRRLHASEIAFWPESTQRDVWISALQAVPDYGSEIIVESTAKGAGGLFYELWELTQLKGSGWIGIFLPWWIHEEYDCTADNPPSKDEIDAIAENPDDFETQALTDGIPWEGHDVVIPLSRLVWRRRTIINRFGGDPTTLGKDATREYQQEYPATPEEAFVASGATYFDEDEVRHLARETKDPVLTGRLIETHDDEGKRKLDFQTSSRGFVRIWEKPDEKGHYVLGVDTAEGKLVASRRSMDVAANEQGGRDYSCGTVLRVVRHGAPGLVATVHGQIASDVFARQVALLGEWYSCGGPNDEPTSTRRDSALVGVESNHASGQRVLQYLKDLLKYRRLYWQREYNVRTKMFERRIGWRTDEKSREILLDSLAELIRKRSIRVPDADTVRELGQFVIDDSGKPGAIDGAHDDRVFGLALAVAMEKEHRHAATMPVPQWQPEDTGSGL